MATNGYVNNPWTAEKTERLIALVKEGMSGSFIASRLEVTRNSVIGKAARLGLRLGNSRTAMSPALASRLRKPHQTPFGKQKNRDRLKAPVKVQFERSPIPAPAIDDIVRKSFSELESKDCRFPIGDPRKPGFGSCAIERAPGSAYCLHHHSRTHTPIPVRTRPELVTAPSEKVEA